MEQDKYFQGAEDIFFGDLGRPMHYLKGTRDHRPPPPTIPWGPRLSRKFILKNQQTTKEHETLPSMQRVLYRKINQAPEK